ncbi:sporulation protein YqfC [Acetohalobium arabaticum]|uniref:Sporulation protein YqfC n=1 Tax=Acetohalobium arabaticum (strain ATCC 49924 / DSM 5501 / Z-7288) TaxID=574087 RepID=D9QV98_ACEAZ|nr:sporulation protein YqfC [Acetohalobium arabaticum]ADL12157.1 sporulation protein YqfC [Acetohalobium arabaticum DSM 5501]
MSQDREFIEELKNKFAELFEMPKDTVLDAPRISMVGNMELTLENHRGIIEYTEDQVRIRINSGQVVISGAELIIADLTKQTVNIKGQIIDISFKF